MEVFEAVKRRMLEWYGPFKMYGRCLYWTHAGIVTLHNDFGIECWPMAGTAKWKWPGAEWEFRWGGEPAPNRHVGTSADGTQPLPEMHVWIYTPGEFIDFSLCELGRVITNLTGEDWKVTLPPFIWAMPHELPPGTSYLPNAQATRLAVEHMLGNPASNQPTQ